LKQNRHRLPSVRYPHLSGIGLKVASGLCFTLGNGLISALGRDVPAGQLMFSRSFFALLIITLWLLGSGKLREAVRVVSPGAHFLRSFIGFGGTICMILALARLPLAETTLLGYASPFFVLLFSAILLGEPFRRIQLAAVVLGFLGVVVVLGGGLETHHGAETEWTGWALALGWAALSAGVAVQIRNLVNRREKPVSIVFYFMAFSSLLSLATLPFGWIWLDWRQGAILAVLGLLTGAGQILMTNGYKYASASTLAPFEYTTLLWALLIGWIAFGNTPDLMVLLGGAIIIAAGLLIIVAPRAGRRASAETPQN
jgi:drug/metabolite transporter (DMT)-like permease